MSITSLGCKSTRFYLVASAMSLLTASCSFYDCPPEGCRSILDNIGDAC